MVPSPPAMTKNMLGSLTKSLSSNFLEKFTLQTFIKDWDYLQRIEELIKGLNKIVTSLPSRFLVNDYNDWPFIGLDFEGNFVLSFGLLLRFRSLLLNFLDSLFERLESIDCESDLFALYFGWLKNEVSHFPKIAFNILPIAKAMSGSAAPQTYVRLKASAYSFAYCAVGAWVVCALSPLVIEFWVLGLWNDVLALGFAQF